MKYGKGSSGGKKNMVSPKSSPGKMMPKKGPISAMAKKAAAKKKSK